MNGPMDAPQDLIQPVPASKAGNAAARPAVDGGGDVDAAAFAEAMRAATDASRPATAESGAAEGARQTSAKSTDRAPEEDADAADSSNPNKDLVDSMLRPSGTPADTPAVSKPSPASTSSVTLANAAASAALASAAGAQATAESAAVPAAVMPGESTAKTSVVDGPIQTTDDLEARDTAAPFTADAASLAVTDDPAAMLAPVAVAVAVERAIGSALVSQPSTGSFRAPDTAMPAMVDTAAIAGRGFVAAALQVPAETSAGDVTSLVGDAQDAQGTAPNQGSGSGWLAVRPDSLALTLADRAIARDPAALVPPQLGSTLQQLDQRLAALSGTLVGDSPATANSAGNTDVFGVGLVSAAAGQTAQTTLQDGSTNAPVRLSVNAPMEQSSRWAGELGDRLAWVASSRLSAATLQMNPAQLGPIEVRIVLNGEQANVSFAAVQPQTRDAIQQALPTLATSFSAQGLSLGQTSVGSENQQTGGNGGGNGGGGAPGSALRAGSEGIDAVDGGSGVTRGGQGLVDTFA
jgi:flagellar hook-length control protein FliK